MKNIVLEIYDDTSNNVRMIIREEAFQDILNESKTMKELLESVSELLPNKVSEEFINNERCTQCGKKKPQDLCSMCADCLENN